jgi:hypothetical protein
MENQHYHYPKIAWNTRPQSHKKFLLITSLQLKLLKTPKTLNSIFKCLRMNEFFKQCGKTQFNQTNTMDLTLKLTKQTSNKVH